MEQIVILYIQKPESNMYSEGACNVNTVLWFSGLNDWGENKLNRKPEQNIWGYE